MLERLIILRQEAKKVSKRDQLCVVFSHEDFRSEGELMELHAVKSHVKVTKEGHPDFFFDVVTPVTRNEEVATAEFVHEDVRVLMKEGNRQTNQFDEADISMASSYVCIDIDTKPAPEKKHCVRSCFQRYEHGMGTQWSLQSKKAQHTKHTSQTHI